MVVITLATAGAVVKVAPSIVSACTLIANIIQEAKSSSKKKEDCSHLAARLSLLRRKLMDRLQPEAAEAPGLAEELARLSATLNEAQKLVVDCQRWKTRKLTRASVLAARFAKVNSRIDSHVIDITAYFQVGMKGCPHSDTPLLQPATATTTSRSLAVVTNERYGQRIRTRDLRKGSARMLIGVVFNKPEYMRKGMATISRS